jgi:uncharacterized membrane protein YphA (DoxX/SURF4 family)
MSHTRFSSARGSQVPRRPLPTTRTGADQAFVLLRTVFTIAPIAFGLDKFFGVLTNWEQYLAPWVNDLVPGTAHQAMLAVGVVEILAGILVAVRPSIGAYVIVAWLAGIIVNLLTLGSYYDVALRDFGLLVGALALARLAGPPFRTTTSTTAAVTGDSR